MDTVYLKQNLRVAFRTRYERFTGDFVRHCHNVTMATTG